MGMHMPKLFFCWERASTGRWGPVCYHGAPPKAEKVSDGDRPYRTPVLEVPEDCQDGDGNPLFGRLSERFPAPVEGV
jgi:hypothetical protein